MKIYKNKLLQLFVVLMFMLYPNAVLEAQVKPGGVALETELWLSADKMQTTLPADGADVNLWQDLSGNNRSFGRNGTDLLPSIKYNSMNYQPSVDFYYDDNVSAANNRSRKLVSSVNFPTQSNKAYYTFWVSEVDSENSDTRATAFAFNYARDDNNGWASTGNLLHTTRGTTTAARYEHQGIGKNYGIGVAIRPNTTAVPQQQYLNGVPRTAASAGRVMYNETARPAVLGNSSLTTTSYFFGDVQEVIVLSAPAGSTMSPVDLAKVNSYLAIKYGQTLDIGYQPDYLRSDGTVVWSGAKNLGYQNDIFGIGRDDASGLYQKQSTNYENSMVTVFVGDNIADLNVGNTSTYFNDKDKSYLMFGANGLKDLTTYVYVAGSTGFLEGSLTEDVNFRHKRVLKAQVTGQANFKVNMKVGATYVLVSANDPTFAPQNTRLYSVKDGIAKDVVINDGEYVSFATYETAPGGVVNGLKLWLKADDLNSLTLNANNKVLVWKDQTSNANNYSLDAVNFAGKTPPQYSTCDMRTNFYPSVFFEASDYLAIKSGPMSQNAPDDFTSFVLYYATAYADNGRLYTHGFGSTIPQGSATNRRPAMGFAPGVGVGRVRNSGGAPGQTDVDGSIPGFVQNSAALQMINTHKQAAGGGGYAIHDFGGWQEKVSATGAFGNGFMMANGGTLGGASLANATFQGLISEVFFYEKALTPDEQDRIRTYMGIKYAITLDADASNPALNYDYKLSDGTIVWAGNSLPNMNYHNNVAGLIRDDKSGLYNNKAKSSAVNATITMMVQGHTECGQGNSPSLVNDLSGLYWGHNGVLGEIDFTGNKDICGLMDFRMARIWLVDKTNIDKQTVTMRIGSSDYFPYGSAGYQVFLLVAKSEADLKNNKWDRAIPATFINGEHELSYTFTEEYTYFGIGVKRLPGACESCDFAGAKKLEFTRATWTNGDMERNFDMGDGFTANVKVNIEAPARMMRRYPRASSFRSLREYRRGDIGKLMTTTVTLSKAAAATFEIFEIDRRLNRYDNVEVYGICNGAKVIPRLSYVVSANRSSYTIQGNTAIAKRRPTSTYTNNRGRMYVEFDYPVEQIIINHKSTGRQNVGYKRIGIGAMEFVCPQPLPPPNEDGLIFVKQGTPEALLCEEVLYTFRIVNTNCDSRTVTFSDILPNGMTWVSQSLSLDEVNDKNAILNDYAQTKILGINNLVVPGASTLVFRAKASFDMNAVAGFYKNRASISYTSDISGPVSLESCDRLTPGCEPTTTKAIDSGTRPFPVEVLEYNATKSCYKADDEVSVTIKVKNPNSFAIKDMLLDISYNEEFSYVTNSLSGTLNFNSPAITELDQGVISVENFSLPAGESIITFKIKAPAESLLEYEVDENGNPILDPDTGEQINVMLDIDFELSTDTDDVCLGATLLNANGALEIPYCGKSKKFIISNKMATSKAKQ